MDGGEKTLGCALALHWFSTTPNMQDVAVNPSQEPIVPIGRKAHQTTVYDPCRDLWATVLDHGLRTLKFRHALAQRREGEARAIALAKWRLELDWIFSRPDSTFDWICTQLDLNAECVRGKLRERPESHSPV